LLAPFARSIRVLVPMTPEAAIPAPIRTAKRMINAIEAAASPSVKIGFGGA